MVARRLKVGLLVSNLVPVGQGDKKLVVVHIHFPDQGLEGIAPVAVQNEELGNPLCGERLDHVCKHGSLRTGSHVYDARNL